MKAKMFRYTSFKTFFLLFVILNASGCDKNSDSKEQIWPEGNYTKEVIKKQVPFLVLTLSKKEYSARL